MHSFICGLAIVQAMVLFLHLYRKLVVLERKRILARNVDWSLENQAFVSKFLHPSDVPYALSTFAAAMGLLLTCTFVGQDLFVWGYVASLFVGIGIAMLFHLPTDFRARKDIPPSQVRVASLNPRTLSMFLPGKIHRAAHVLVAMVFAGDLAFFLLHVISGYRFFSMLLLHILVFGALYTTLVYYLRERSIHHSSIVKISNADFDTQYKRTSIGMTITFVYLLIAMSAAGFVSWAYGYEFWPSIPMMLSLMKAPDTMPFLFSNNGVQVCRAILIAVSLPLLFWIPRSDAYRDIDKLSFTRE